MTRLASTLTGTRGVQSAEARGLPPTVVQPDSNAADPAVKARRSSSMGPTLPIAPRDVEAKPMLAIGTAATAATEARKALVARRLNRASSEGEEID